MIISLFGLDYNTYYLGELRTYLGHFSSLRRYLNRQQRSSSPSSSLPVSRSLQPSTNHERYPHQNEVTARNCCQKDYTTASSQLSELKLDLLRHNALIPSSDTQPTLLRNAREILEVGTVVSIYQNDDAAFLRYYAQLQPLYADSAVNKVPSKNKNKIVGLYLLLLLTRNNIADFHTTLENMNLAEEDVFVRYPVMLERWLMEGSYDKVWQATKGSHVPSEEYGRFSEV
jgi:hypothetical protein